MKQKKHAWIVYAVLCLLAVLVIYPVFFALISSLKPVPAYTADKLGLPENFYTENYTAVLFKMGLLRYLLNTIITVAIAMLIYTLICSAAGLAFGKLRFKGRLLLFSLVLFFQIFPQMVVAGELYQLISRMRLLNSRPGIVLAWVAYFAPFGAYIMTTYFAVVPKEILESARIDNANIFQILFRIMMPIAKPMLGTICIIGTLAMWNELPFAMLILQQAELRTVTIGIALLQGEFGLPIPTLAAAVIVSAAVPLICYLFFQDFVAMDATAGAVKG
jgi:ABC-type glycerol-3-phosphate transport system permease component